MNFWQAVLAHLSKNWEAYSISVSAIAAAAVSEMPSKFPRTIDDWWGWARATFQTAIPIRFRPPASSQLDSQKQGSTTQTETTSA